jgi:hypothetical protein
MIKSLTYYCVDLFTGEITRHEAESQDDLDITLENGDCVKTLSEAESMREKIIRGDDTL